MLIPLTISVLVGSLIGMGVVLWRSVPRLRIVAVDSEDVSIRRAIKRVARSVLSRTKVQNISRDKLLERSLSRARVLSLRAEGKTERWLRQVRQRSKKKRQTLSNSYLDNLKRRRKEGE